MDIFREVRERADILKVCDILGIRLDRNYKCLCPFSDHREKTPSFSISPSKNIFYCFGCGKKGNSITLVQELLGIKPLEAAKYINQHLGLGIEINDTNIKTSVKEKKKNNASFNKYNQERNSKNFFKQKENKVFQILCDYFHLLEEWEDLADLGNDLYIEALKNKDKVEYYIDIFIYGTDADRKWFLNTNGKVVREYARRLGRK